MDTRTERDALGEVAVPEAAYYGAATQRAKENFPIGSEKMPLEVIRAMAWIKKAAAQAHEEMGLLSHEKAQAIQEAADEVLAGKFDDQFPLVIWQTGSGTQSHMNVNEVIANRAIEKLGGQRGTKTPVHPNDDVNRSQSSNDVFPTAMHVAAMLLIQQKLLPALEAFQKELENKAQAFSDIVKIGRTHLMDATPLTLGQEFSGYASQIEQGISALKNTFPHLRQLALGGTAVGTGLNAPKGFAEKAIAHLNHYTGESFKPAPNRFEALASSDTMVEVSGALKRLAASFMKIANDIRLMGSGPRSGFSELVLPANEPGSSIMPGKVNPTQAEAMSQAVVQVLGNDAAIGVAASLGNFELNVYRPLIIYNLLQSIHLLAGTATSFTDRCLKGLSPNHKRIEEHLQRSLMLATALNTHLGYDKAAQIVQKAHNEDLTLKEAALSLGLLDAATFDALIDPKHMLGDSKI